RDVVNGFVIHELRHAFDQPLFADLVRDLCNNDCLAIFAECLNFGFSAHHEAATAGFVGFENAALAVNDSSGRKVRSFHELQNLGKRGRGIVHQANGRLYNLGQVVRRDVGGHADGNSVRPVHQKVGNSRREDNGLQVGVVVGGLKVDCIFINIGVKV